MPGVSASQRCQLCRAVRASRGSVCLTPSAGAERVPDGDGRAWPDHGRHAGWPRGAPGGRGGGRAACAAHLAAARANRQLKKRRPAPPAEWRQRLSFDLAHNMTRRHVQLCKTFTARRQCLKIAIRRCCAAAGAASPAPAHPDVTRGNGAFPSAGGSCNYPFRSQCAVRPPQQWAAGKPVDKRLPAVSVGLQAR